ncbi:UNVERIFIED_CONTAM: hypothetical protein PYX00_006405 [Menopon gallinae]|uniref:HYDIN/VesB/CFA65-like Ig-like domain-containing protein n=1 Tax=Menopon gallinae TaxID=328185 RepID=A0AAW2HV94_9NEOP
MDGNGDNSSDSHVVRSSKPTDLFMFLVSSRDTPQGMVTPSQFIKEMSYTTEERYNMMLRPNAMCIQDFFPNYSDISLTPRVLIFQSCEILKSYSLIVTVRNCRKSMLQMQMECPKSINFTAKMVGGAGVSKIAPGLTAEYEVTFTPTDGIDYKQSLVLRTKGGSFSVPIIALGPRVLIDFPDEITLPPAPVKIPISKIVIARNVGSAAGSYTFLNRGCFKVEPSKGFVNPKEVVSFSIIFESAVVGNFSEIIYLRLDTGENLAIKVHGSAENINVRLDKKYIYHDDTFVGLKRSKIFHIQNNTPHLVKFSWKRNKTWKEDMSIIERMKEKYIELKDLEMRKDTKQEYLKVCSHKVHELACERILQDEIRLLESEEFRFSHPAFAIVPESGEVFPKCQTELFAVFEPNECGTLQAEAYVEVSGRDERLTLRMKGAGLGPKITLSIEVLDIDYIFLCSVHTYELVACNKGDVSGTISFRQEPLVFGGRVEVKPNTKYLSPGEHVGILVSFTSNKHGDFTEKLNFEIVETGEIVSFVLKGKIVSPTLHFDKTQIDFGTVSLGFPVTKEVTLSNLSMVPVTFSLRVLGEGNQPSISHEQFARMAIKPEMPTSPKEFEIEPTEGVVEPFSRRTAVLTLTANIARKWSTNLMVDMWDSETESVSCPINYTALAPNIAIEPNVISIPFCFVDFAYTRPLTLENTSRMSAFYYIVPQDPREQSAITFSPNISQGIIKQKGSVKILLTIRSSALGRQTLPLRILIFGNDTPMDVCQICCVGQGPVVTMKPTTLVWGEVSLLKLNTKELIINNESPIAATFVATMSKSDSPWTVSPAQSVLSPGEKVILNVGLLLRDRGKYQDVLKLQITNGKTLLCTTSAVGVGNSLFMEPNISDKYALGTLFSNKKYAFPIYVKNEGTKTIGIVWCPHEDYKAFVTNKFLNPPGLKFVMQPKKIDLHGGASKVLYLEVFSHQTGYFTQHFYCHANVDMPSKELYMVSEISAEFVEPLISFDKEEVTFCYNVSPSGVYEKLTDKINIVNTSDLPVSISLTLNDPFYINTSSGMVCKIDLDLGGSETEVVEIGFKAMENPQKRCLLYTDKLNVTFKEHSKKVSCLLQGEINYPNLLLIPRKVDFGCIPVANSAYREFIMVNISPVEVKYQITWDQKSCAVMFLNQGDFPMSKSYFEEFTEHDADGKEDVKDEDRFIHTISFDSFENPPAGYERSEITSVKEHDAQVYEGGAGGVQTQVQIQPPEDSDSALPKKPVLKIPEIEVQDEDVKNMVFPLAEKYYTADEILMNVYKEGAMERDHHVHFNKYFDITPFYGRLDKFESQIMSVSFQPNRIMKANAVARVDVEAGPTEFIHVRGIASDLTFALDKLHIHFGRQLFCETANEYLKITNTSFLEFDFETNTVDPVSADMNGNFPIEAGVLIVTPRIGHVPGMTEKVLRVRYHPGLPGMFEERFQLRIGYLEPITILVSGYAVFPQVHFTLPRTEMTCVPVEIGYAAIASITPDWLLTRVDCQKFDSTLSAERTNSENEGEKSQSLFETNIELEDDWVVINNLDCVPTEIDIHLAIERILAFKLLTTSDGLHSKMFGVSRAIPNFFVPAYEMDFGIVIAGRSVEETFIVNNYGPLPVILYFPAERDYKSRAMRIKMRTRNDIRVGESTTISINFDTTKSRFVELYERVEYMFYFEINHGARIPVRATAIVTYPSVSVSTKFLNFNEVKCGNCKVMTMKLKNFGWVPATWYLSFRLTSREVGYMHQSGILDGRDMFHLSTTKGVLFPNESCLLQISFKPEFGGKFSASMMVRVEEGLEEYKVVLTGEAVEARLKISDTVINFGAALPYTMKLFKCFSVQNPCSFPVEFYFPDYDKQIIEENLILRTLILYYQTNEVLLPIRNPGDGLPQEVLDFYRTLLENLNARYAEKLREKTLKSYHNFSTTTVSSSIVKDSDIFERKKSKIKRVSSSSRMRSRILAASAISMGYDGLPTLKDKSPEEIEDMLSEFIKITSSSEHRLNPLAHILGNNLTVPKNEGLESIRGLVIILHAAPYSTTNRFAKHCSKFVGKPSLTIDRIVLEEVALTRCDAAIVLRGIIEDTHEEHSAKARALKDSQAGIDNWREIPYEVTMKELEKKLNQLFVLRELSRDKLQTEEKPVPPSSARKDRASTPNAKPAHILEGTEEIVYEILRFRLQMEAISGLVIEHLNSMWITNHANALKTIVRACGNISDMVVICMRMSLDKLKEFIILQKEEQVMRETQIKEDALKALDEESEEYFRAIELPEEVKKELVAKYLVTRHEEYNAYLKMMEERTRMKKTKSQNAKLAFSTASSAKDKRGASTKEKEKKESGDRSVKTKGKTRERERTSKSKAPSEGENQHDLSKKYNEKEEMLFKSFDDELMDIMGFLQHWDRTVGMSRSSQGIIHKPRRSTSSRKSTADVQEKLEKAEPDIGIPFWIINENSRKSGLEEAVFYSLQQMLIQRRNSHDSMSWGQDVPESVTYTVVTFPPHRHPTASVPAFQLASVDRSASSVSTDDERPAVDSESQISMRSKKRSSGNAKIRMESRASVMSKTAKSKKNFNPGFLSDSITDENFKARCILQEGESAFWCVQFSPTTVGRYEQFYSISMSSPPNNNYVIKCTGICDIPRLDMNPENIFTRVAWKKPADYIYLPTFFYSKYYFDFGSVIPNQSRDDGRDRELHAIFSLTNISSLPVDLTVMFAEDALREQPTGSKNFLIEPTEGHLEPYQTFLLNIYANPSKYGPVEEMLLIFIRGNPKIESITVKCYGVKVSVSVEPRVIDFDRMLLFRKDRKKITFTNCNLIPLFVTLSGYNKLPPQFSFSAVKSWVQPLKSFVIEIEYQANEVQVINNESIQVLIYDRTEAPEPVQTLNFTVSAEAYDASVDIYMASKEDNHMDFEDLRIQNEYKKSMTLKNTGKYDLGFKVVIDYELLEKNGNEEFFVSPDEGILAVGKPYVLTVNFLARSEVYWKKLPLFRINLNEPYNHNELVASIPIEVSARTFFSRYVIQPLSELNIGPVEVGLQKSVKVCVENKGHFSFTYSIESPNVEVVETDTSKKSAKKASEASSRQKKRDKEKDVPESLNVGCFDITPCSGIVNIKETALIIVNFTPTEVRRYEETVVMKITESPPHLKDGNELRILAEGCIPELNLDDWASMFREHRVRNSDKDLPQISEFGYQTFFTIDKQQLCFKNACLGKTVEGRVHLENKGQIHCHVTLSMSKPEVNRNRTSAEVEGEFWVEPLDVIIPPYESGTFVIFFRPETLVNYRSQLTLTLVMPERYTHITRIINLYGIVCVPRVEIVQPIARTIEGDGEVNFRPTTPGRVGNSLISFRNVGKIDCRVVLEIQQKDGEIFSLLPTSETESMLQAWESSKPITHTTLVKVSPGKIAEFNVFFKPLEIKTYNSEIRLFVIDNGFENVRFLLNGEAFLEEVVLERFQMSMPFAENPEESSSFLQPTPGVYFLNLGHCFTSKKKRFLARLMNRTEKEFFKFEWEENALSLAIQPPVGHLHPGTYKEILFVYLPHESVEVEEVPVACKLFKIRYQDTPKIPPWDRRRTHQPDALMNELDFTSSRINKSSITNQSGSQEMGKMFICLEEPEHDVVPESNREIILYISAVSDYARPNCEVTNVHFADTFMFQTRTFSLPIENTGNVALDYTLYIKSVTFEPVKVHESQQARPSSILGSRVISIQEGVETKPKKFYRKNLGARPKPLSNEKLLDTSMEDDDDVHPKWSPVDIKSESYNPIHLENASGRILPKEKVFCQITFSPLDVNEYKGIIKMKVDNTHPEQVLPEILVSARSIMPYCHFDLPESDYLQSGRRDYSRPGPIGSGPGMPLDPKIKTVEVKVLGTRVTKPIHFYAINPTECDYSFMWVNVTQNKPDEVQSLHCSDAEGVIQAGRQKLMEFVFVSQFPGTFEYFWKFCIPEYETEMVFLFVVIAQEPIMYFVPNNLIMSPTSVGGMVSGWVNLVNEDDVSSDFFFQPDSLYADGRLNFVKVQPMSGKIEPKSEMNFKITFIGKTGGKILFKLKCKLKKLQNPVVITVETTTYAVEPLVSYIDLGKGKSIAKPNINNIVDFGTEVQVNKPETISFFLSSTSKLSFYYEWLYDRKELANEQCSLTFSTVEGHVTSFARDECRLTVEFSRKSHLRNFLVKLKIKRGPVYNFLLNAEASAVCYEFSFTNYDFGYCYIQSSNHPYYKTALVFRNKDKTDVLIESILDNLQAFKMNMKECFVGVGQELLIPIEFYPRECRKYEEEIRLRIGGAIQRDITFSGHGAEFRVVLADVSHMNVHFGAVKIGRKEAKEFVIINKGPTAATIVVGFSDQLPMDPAQLANADGETDDLPVEHRLSHMLTLTPARPFIIKSKETYSIRVDYFPKARAPAFTETVYMQFQEKVNPLCIVSGSTIGPEFSLDKDYLTFGAVVANCCSTLKLKIINSGDVGAKFKWETSELEDEYSLSPESGYLTAGSDIIINVKFKPKIIRCCVKGAVECKLFLSDTETYPPLKLKLLGDCVDLPPPTLSVPFKCCVRQSETKQISIINKTGTDWNLLPIVGGEYFTGPDVISVPSMSTRNYDITYRPLVMTQPDVFHKGSICVCLPNGVVNVYELIGTSLQPDAKEIIYREVPCKTKYIELLNVKNWLRSHQRFNVTRVCTMNENSEDLVYTCMGSDVFELAPSAEKEYKLTFHAYKVGKLRFSITFTNVETNEYLWFDITFTVVMCGPLDIISLYSSVRKATPHAIRIENPLLTPVQYKIECTNHEILVPNIDLLPPQSSREVIIAYRPLHAGEKKEHLKVSCPELGVFPIDLRLQASEAAPLEPIFMETALGNTETHRVKVPNYCNSTSSFYCWVTSDDFRVDERIIAPGQGQALIDVTFEPSSLGQSTAELHIDSEQAGYFTYPLIGKALTPPTKGPFTVKYSSPLTIVFKNVLKETKKFKIFVDNPAFAVKSTVEEIPPGNVSSRRSARKG